MTYNFILFWKFKMSKICVFQVFFRANSSFFLFPKLSNSHVLIQILLHDFGHCHFEILLRHVNSPLPQSEHASLRANTLQNIQKTQFLSLVSTLTSAPDAPGIFSAIFFISMPLIRFILLEWIFRISILASTVGLGNSIFRSILPGRINA